MTKMILNFILLLILIAGIFYMLMSRGKAQSRVENDASYEVFYASDLRAMNVCKDYEIDMSPPDSKEIYRSYQYQFELQLPINEKWSTIAHRLSLFENTYLKDPAVIHSLEFGPVIQTETIHCQRSHELLVIKSRKYAEVLSSLKQSEQTINAHRISKNINALSIEGEEGQQTYLELFGPKYNVILLSSYPPIKDFPELTAIAKEFRFLE